MKIGIRRPPIRKQIADQTSVKITYLEQLKQQRLTFEEFLQLQKECTSSSTSEGMRITMEIYTMILEDAIKTANSLIQSLETVSIKKIQ